MIEGIIALISGFHDLFVDPLILVLLIGGVFIGMVFGAIPGLTAALGVALFLPFTFSLNPNQGMGFLVALYVGGISGGLYGATLLNIPGTPASLVTLFDGYPMAKKGRAALALSLGIFSSFVGGIISAILLVIISPLLSKISLMFGAWEYFSLGLFGLMVVISLCSESIIKGLISISIGTLIQMVGMDPILGVNRLTFNIWQLMGGFSLLAVLMGFFAIGEILVQVQSLGKQKYLIKIEEKVRIFPELKIIMRNFQTFLVSSLIGTWVGILPGVGQSVGSMMAYDQAKKSSKNPEKFGKGCEEGIIASEAANNAVNGGALIPMLTLGVPGDLVTAIMMGGLIMHGLQPGPLLFRDNFEVVGSIFASYLVSVVFMLVIALLMIKVFLFALKISTNFLFPVISVLCVIGTYTLNNRLFDVWVLFFTGLLGYFLVKCRFKLPPIVLAYILAPIIERNFRIAIIRYDNNFLTIFQRPISGTLLILGFIFLFMPYIKKILKKIRSHHI